MTPADLNKSLTHLLDEQLADTGFSKKRIRELHRKTSECEQFLSFYFTRDHGLPGNVYSLIPNMSFAFPLIDKLTCEFMGEKYDSKWPTAAQSLCTVVPNSSACYKYRADEPLEQLAAILSADFRTYALPFYEKFDTLRKLERYFEQPPSQIISQKDFHIVRTSKSGNSLWCCKAAVLCALEEWEKLRNFLNDTDLLSLEQKKRITEYISDR